MADTTPGLAERLIPVRGAARKASESFAEQLTDSPGRSDADSPSSSNPFREPTHRTKTVKYRYSATGKHLSSPLKANPSSPERNPRKSGLPKVAVSTPAPSSHADGSKRSVLSTTDSGRRTFVLGDHRIHLGFSLSPSPLSSVSTTPLSSPPPTVEESFSNRPKRLAACRSLSLRSLHPVPSKSSVLSQPLSSKRKKKNTKTKPKKDPNEWSIGNSFWMLVDRSGAHSDIRLHPRPGTEPFMWWPAQVVQEKPLRLSLFGDFPTNDPTSRGLCTIFDTSPYQIQSINDNNGTRRFSRATFRVNSLSTDTDPPTEKALDDIASFEARWEAAVQCMEKAATLEKDGLPALLSSYATSGETFYDSLEDSDPAASEIRQPPPRKKRKIMDSTKKLKPRRSKVNWNEIMSDRELRSWSFCPPDPTLQIPGELILAMAPRTGASYWPAQILEHVPGPKEKYKVKFLDEKEYVITRDKFWTSEEDEFVHCTLGHWESAVKTTDDDIESGDEGGEYDVDDGANAEDPNTTTSLLPPPPAKDFGGLSVRAQVAYVKPVLRAILKKDYAPAREKHEAFMKGGSGRAALLKSAGLRGGMDARLVKAVQKVICEWVIGESTVKPERFDAGVASEAEGMGEEGEIIKAISPQVAPAENVPCRTIKDEEMEVERMIVPDARTDSNDSAVNGALPLSSPVNRNEEAIQDSRIIIDGQEQQPLSLLPANGVALSPAIKQASLALKSQLDLLAEVSQAVATEPSLLPSHPEVPKLNVSLLGVAREDSPFLPSPLTPLPDDDQQMAPWRNSPTLCEDFEALSGVEKLDYCLNILLPESILQLFLWRLGERTSSTLLSPEEEQRLHDVGTRRSAETDWVDDVVRLREAQARLRGIDPRKRKAEIPQHDETRLRPRRGTVSRP